MKTLGGLVLIAALLTGCMSSTGEDGREVREDAPSQSESAEPKMPFAEACPELEAASPNGLFPTREEWNDFQVVIAGLRAEGDTETLNALDILLPAVDDLAREPSGMALLDAREAYRDALDVLATRCKAVGSGAFQG